MPIKHKKYLKNTYLYLANGASMIVYIFLYAVCMSTLYDTQKKQKKVLFYKQEKEKLLQELILLQNSTHIKAYAKNVLHMQPLQLEKIKKIVISKGYEND